MTEANNTIDNGAIDWDDSIEKESEFVVAPAGDYDFTVVDFERGRHEGSEKLPPCNMANVQIQIIDSNGEIVTIFHRLFLHKKTEGMLSAFFAGIGQKKKDEPLKMDWSKVPGSTGRAKVGTKIYKDNEYNEIKKFYPKDDSYGKSKGSSAETVAKDMPSW